MLSLSSWRRIALETFGLLAGIAVLKHWFLDVAEIPGMPHPYWLVVVLVSSQYGMAGGMIATGAACTFYLFELPSQSVAQDFYDYARMAALQPMAWLATTLILGGLRNLQIYQGAELADQLATCRRRAIDLADGFERALAEINALEHRIAADTCSVAALSRSLSGIDMSDRRAAAVSFGGLFQIGTGVTTLTIYLKSSDSFVPVLSLEGDTICPVVSIEPLHLSGMEAVVKESGPCGTMGQVEKGEHDAERHVVLVPPCDVSCDALAVIVCETLPPSRDVRQFGRRAEEFSRAFATILAACPDHPSRGRRRRARP